MTIKYLLPSINNFFPFVQSHPKEQQKIQKIFTFALDGVAFFNPHASFYVKEGLEILRECRQIHFSLKKRDINKTFTALQNLVSTVVMSGYRFFYSRPILIGELSSKFFREMGQLKTNLEKKKYPESFSNCLRMSETALRIAAYITLHPRLMLAVSIIDIGLQIADSRKKYMEGNYVDALIHLTGALFQSVRTGRNIYSALSTPSDEIPPTILSDDEVIALLEEIAQISDNKKIGREEELTSRIKKIDFKVFSHSDAILRLKKRFSLVSQETQNQPEISESRRFSVTFLKDKQARRRLKKILLATGKKGAFSPGSDTTTPDPLSEKRVSDLKNISSDPEIEETERFSKSPVNERTGIDCKTQQNAIERLKERYFPASRETQNQPEISENRRFSVTFLKDKQARRRLKKILLVTGKKGAFSPGSDTTTPDPLSEKRVSDLKNIYSDPVIEKTERFSKSSENEKINLKLLLQKKGYTSHLQGINFSRIGKKSDRLHRLITKFSSECSFSDIKFTDCEFFGFDFDKTEFLYVDFIRVRFVETNFQDVILDDCDFIECRFTETSFRNTRFRDCLFIRTSFDSGNFNNCLLLDISFFETRFRKTNFSDVGMPETDNWGISDLQFLDRDGKSTMKTDKKASTRNTDKKLSGKKSKKKDESDDTVYRYSYKIYFNSCRFQRCLFPGADLRSSKWKKTEISDSDFGNALFFKSTLSDVTFVNTSLDYAGFDEIYLDDLKIFNCGLSGTYFYDTETPESPTLLVRCDLTDTLLDLENPPRTIDCTDNIITKPVVGIIHRLETRGFTTRELYPSLIASGNIPIPLKLNKIDKARLHTEIVEAKLKAVSGIDSTEFFSLSDEILKNTAPNSEMEKLDFCAKRQMNRVDAVIIPGGDDVEMIFYEEESGRLEDNDNATKTVFELFICREAARLRMPLIGICRGAQLGALYYGAPGLNRNLKGQWERIQTYRTEEGQIRNIIGESITGISIHEQAVSDPGPRLTVSIRYGEIIKALEHSNGLVYLLQFHPELGYGSQGSEITSNNMAIFAHIRNMTGKSRVPLRKPEDPGFEST